MKNLSRKHIYWAVATLVFIYVALRAFLISFSIDEGMSYRFVVGIWEDKHHSNNHFLNTQLMKISSAIFGNEPWSLRLPNLLVFVLYLWMVWKLIKDASTSFSMAFGMVVMLGLPFMLEMFAIARGYGLSMGFTLLGMAFFILAATREMTDSHYQKQVVLSSVLLGLGVASNLSVINVVIAIVGLLLLHQIIRLKHNGGKVNWIGFAASLVVNFISLGLGVNALLRLKANNDLVFGSQTYEELARKSVWSYIYVQPVAMWVRYLLLVVLILVVVLGIYTAIRKAKLYSRISMVMAIILISMLGWVFEYEVMEANLPLGRTGVIYLPLLGYAMFLLVDYWISHSNRWIRVTKVLASIVMAAYLYNAKAAINVREIRPWPEFALFDKYTDVIAELSKDREEPVVIEKHFLFRSTLNYYLLEKGINAKVNEDYGIKANAEFLLINRKDFVMLEDDPRLDNYETPEGCQDWYTRLFVRKDLLRKE
ncbi:MAG: hypothetical protein EP346_12310 [Bacteroidetes bacterium]|nr:MAG: hypothetical protein EP346_12310 [Bacteroidota bacterium]